MTKTLSPAAQAVLDAYQKARDGQYIGGEWIQDEVGQVAAALRAVADQVVPENIFGPPENVAVAQREITRAQLLAIAAELEAQP